MQVVYDKSVDVLMFYFSDGAVADSDEETSGIVMDYDASGNIVAIEVLDASKRVSNPEEIQFSMLSQSSTQPKN